MLNHSDEKSQEYTELIEKTDQALSKPAKKDLVRSAKDFLGGAFGNVKNKDLNQLVEEFTAEMTLVAEGLSEDQANLSRASEELSARQTIDHEALLKETRALNERMDKLEKQCADLKKLAAEKKIRKVEGFTGLLRQATWLAVILAGSWIVVTIINFFRP